MAAEDPWLGLTEAAQRSGLAREAIRARARRGQVPSRKGNRGELMVQLPAELLTGHSQGESGPGRVEARMWADLVTDLTSEAAELRERLAKAETEARAAEAVAEAKVEAARDVASARVSAAKLEVAAVRELADRLTVEIADARRPWWRKLIG